MENSSSRYYVISFAKFVVSIIALIFMVFSDDDICLPEEIIFIFAPFVAQFILEFLFIYIYTKALKMKFSWKQMLIINILAIDTFFYMLFLMMFSADTFLFLVILIKVLVIIFTKMIDDSSEESRDMRRK